MVVAMFVRVVLYLKRSQMERLGGRSCSVEGKELNKAAKQPFVAHTQTEETTYCMQISPRRALSPG